MNMFNFDQNVFAFICFGAIVILIGWFVLRLAVLQNNKRKLPNGKSSPSTTIENITVLIVFSVFLILLGLFLIISALLAL